MKYSVGETMEIGTHTPLVRMKNGPTLPAANVPVFNKTMYLFTLWASNPTWRNSEDIPPTMQKYLCTRLLIATLFVIRILYCQISECLSIANWLNNLIINWLNKLLCTVNVNKQLQERMMISKNWHGIISSENGEKKQSANKQFMKLYSQSWVEYWVNGRIKKKIPNPSIGLLL